MAHRIIRSWYTGRWWVGCYIWYSEEGTGRAAAPPSPLLALQNVTTHSSTASVPVTVLLYDGLLLCGFNVAIKGLTMFGAKEEWKDCRSSGWPVCVRRAVDTKAMCRCRSKYSTSRARSSCLPREWSSLDCCSSVNTSTSNSCELSCASGTNAAVAVLLVW